MHAVMETHAGLEGGKTEILDFDTVISYCKVENCVCMNSHCLADTGFKPKNKVDSSFQSDVFPVAACWHRL